MNQVELLNNYVEAQAHLHHMNLWLQMLVILPLFIYLKFYHCPFTIFITYFSLSQCLTIMSSRTHSSTHIKFLKTTSRSWVLCIWIHQVGYSLQQAELHPSISFHFQPNPFAQGSMGRSGLRSNKHAELSWSI